MWLQSGWSRERDTDVRKLERRPSYPTNLLSAIQTPHNLMSPPPISVRTLGHRTGPSSAAKVFRREWLAPAMEKRFRSSWSSKKNSQSQDFCLIFHLCLCFFLKNGIIFSLYTWACPRRPEKVTPSIYFELCDSKGKREFLPSTPAENPREGLGWLVLSQLPWLRKAVLWLASLGHMSMWFKWGQVELRTAIDRRTKMGRLYHYQVKPEAGEQVKNKPSTNNQQANTVTNPLVFWVYMHTYPSRPHSLITCNRDLFNRSAGLCQGPPSVFP